MTSPYTIVLAWGEADEGQYHWAGRAKDEAKAIRAARKAMDDSYNDEYCRGINPCEKRGGRYPTEYEVIDIAEGVNEYAASEMLAALKMLMRRYTFQKDDAKAVRKAIRRGEGRE